MQAHNQATFVSERSRYAHPQDIVVEMAQMKMTRSPNRLVTYGIGSCIIITLYDPTKKMGMLSHTMFPNHTGKGPNTNPFRSVDSAVVEMIKRIKASGSRIENLEAKIVGGADMFPNIGNGGMPVGEENVLASKEALLEGGVGLIGEVVGGNVGRSVVFDTASGIVTVMVKI